MNRPPNSVGNLRDRGDKKMSDVRIPVLMAKIAAMQQAIDHLNDQLLKRGVQDILDVDIYRDISEISAYVAERTGVPIGDIRSNRKYAGAARARQIVMYLARKYTSHSLPKIGRFVKKDHTSVMHGIRRIGQLMETDSRLTALIEGFNRESPELAEPVGIEPTSTELEAAALPLS